MSPGASAEEGGGLAGVLGLTFLAALGGVSSESPCRPASSGVIGPSENSCHLLSAAHYHFFLSHLRSLWLAGCGSHSMTISSLREMSALILRV